MRLGISNNNTNGKSKMEKQRGKKGKSGLILVFSWCINCIIYNSKKIDNL